MRKNVRNYAKKRILAALASVTLAASALPSAVFAAGFSDVTSKDYYYTATEVLNDMGILEGYPDGSYKPAQSVTRAEMATIICKVQGYESEAKEMAGRTDYTDVASDHWASGYINKATDEGIICGDGDGTFRPEDNVNYEEAVKMVVCAAGKADEAAKAGGYPYGHLVVANGRGYTDNVRGVTYTAASRGDIAVLVYNSQTADLTPVSSLKAGRYYVKQSLTLSTGYDDATIYYTVNGSDPLKNGKVYRNPIEVSDVFTLKTAAVRNGFESKVVTYAYTIRPASGVVQSDDLLKSRYKLYVDADEDKGTITPSSTSTHLGGAGVTVTAVANEGYTFDRWESYSGGTFSDESSAETRFLMPYNNTTITAVFLKLHTVKIDLGYESDNAPSDMLVADGKKASVPVIASRDGYNFIGWYADEDFTESFDFTKSITADTTIYAKWEEIPKETITYKVSFDMGYENPENPVSEQSIAENTAVTEPTVPIRDGYKFSGWYADSDYTTEYDFATLVTSDITIYAKWELPAEYSFIYNMNYDGAQNISFKITEGEYPSEPNTPVRDGYRFNGWYADAECNDLYAFDEPVMADTTIYAGWTKAHTVTLYYHENASETQLLNDGEFISEPSVEAVDGYEFDGWYTDQTFTEKYDFSTPVTSDIVLYAKWIHNTVYAVTFNYNYETAGEPDVITTAPGGVIEKPADPVRDDYVFGGWYADKECNEAVDFTAPVRADTTVYAKWTALEKYTVSFDLNYSDASSPASQSITAGDNAARPSEPERDGYEFGGWYADKQCTQEYDFSTAVTADITIYAKWDKSVEYDVYFDLNYDGADATQNSVTVVKNSKVTEPAAPVRDGYKFEGWYTDKSCTEKYDFTAPVTGSITLYAGWSVSVELKVSDFKADKTDIAVGVSETVTFTVKLENFTDQVPVMKDSNGNDIYKMFDNGTNGDETAGDGIFTFKAVLMQPVPIEQIYYVDVNGVLSDKVTISFK